MGRLRRSANRPRNSTNIQRSVEPTSTEVVTPTYLFALEPGVRNTNVRGSAKIEGPSTLWTGVLSKFIETVAAISAVATRVCECVHLQRVARRHDCAERHSRTLGNGPIARDEGRSHIAYRFSAPVACIVSRTLEIESCRQNPQPRPGERGPPEEHGGQKQWLENPQPGA